MYTKSYSEVWLKKYKGKKKIEDFYIYIIHCLFGRLFGIVENIIVDFIVIIYCLVVKTWVTIIILICNSFTNPVYFGLVYCFKTDCTSVALWVPVGLNFNESFTLSDWYTWRCCSLIELYQFYERTTPFFKSLIFRPGSSNRTHILSHYQMLCRD